MASTYTNNTGLEKPGTGEQSGAWGATTNLNFDIIDRAVNGVGTITIGGTTHTLTTSDGALSDGGYKVLVIAGSPTGTNTITIDPNNSAKCYLVNNTTSQTVVFTQGSGGNASIPAGVSQWIYADGAGAGAQVYELPNDVVDDTSPQLGGNLDLNNFDIIGTGDVNITGAITCTGTITATGGVSPPGSGTITVTLKTGGWTITQDGSNNMMFAYGGANKMKLDSSGNLTVVGNVTAYGSV
jgi:hypothetical protein